ncbi:hypothetical protein LWI29_029941 [Acer saccharum]|uniref:Uncharacterized protein n=1 Tax=Acer saccharum TaxID=4024 RepID=A0AA39T6D6_ACESA|nr:hypothetical protein LWI29_029941 [Acer saccharum]
MRSFADVVKEAGTREVADKNDEVVDYYGSSSFKEYLGHANDKPESNLKGIGLQVELRGGLELNFKFANRRVKVGLEDRSKGREVRLIQSMMKKGLLKSSLIPDGLVISAQVSEHTEAVRSEDMVRIESIMDSPASSKGRRGSKQCYSTKIHRMRTRNAKLRELEAQELRGHVKPIEEIRDILSHSLTETEIETETKTEVVDVDGKIVVWNLEEEILRVVETGAALAKKVNGKTV